LPESRAPTIRLRLPRFDRFLGAFRLRADVAGRDPGTVTFAFRSRGMNTWVRLGTDDDPRYRIALEPDRFAKGRRIWVVALVRSSSGNVAASNVQSFVRK
jgi:hypothetical protein